MDRIYGFTNENVFSYQSLYNFSGANVLSVLGSGDQYFSSLLYGANCVEVFDINPLAWDFFVLKFYGITTMSFEDFYKYFVNLRMNSWHYFEIICKYMPPDVSKRLNDLYNEHHFLSFYIRSDSGTNFDDSIIPYLNKEKYYQLQTLLRKQKLPTFYLEDLANLPRKLSDKKFDIILASNIIRYIYYYTEDERKKISGYKDLLDHFDCPNIQASYCWGHNKCNLDEILNTYKENGFDIDKVNPNNIFRSSSDYVISLRRK